MNQWEIFVQEYLKSLLKVLPNALETAENIILHLAGLETIQINEEFPTECFVNVSVSMQIMFENEYIKNWV